MQERFLHRSRDTAVRPRDKAAAPQLTHFTKIVSHFTKCVSLSRDEYVQLVQSMIGC